MALPGWPEDSSLGKIFCVEKRQTWQCPNMRPKEGDKCMSGEHYECKACGATLFLDYDEMR